MSLANTPCPHCKEIIRGPADITDDQKCCFCGKSLRDEDLVETLRADLEAVKAERDCALSLSKASGKLREESGADALIIILRMELPDEKDVDLTIVQKVAKLANLRHYAAAKCDELQAALSASKAREEELLEALRVKDEALSIALVGLGWWAGTYPEGQGKEDDDNIKFINEALSLTPESIKDLSEAREAVIIIARTLCSGNVRFDEAWGRYLAAKKAQEAAK